MNEIIALCQVGNYSKAIVLLESKIKANDVSSELYRIYGQVLFDLERFDEALDALIESLKIDSSNQYSLILIGNIYGIHKKDIDTALTYYNKILESNSTDVFSLTNIASVLAKNKRDLEAEEYYNRAISIDSKFPHALYGLSLLRYNRGENYQAFDLVTKCLRLLDYNHENNALRQNAENLATECAKTYTSKYNSYNHPNPLLEELSSLSLIPIDIEIDNTIDTPAKLEVAEYKGTKRHVIKYKKDSLEQAHLLYHELLHLKLIFEARTENNNEVFTSKEVHLERFKKKYKVIASNLKKKGLEAAIEGLYLKLFDGLNLQLFNAPLDLFIEDIIHKTYTGIRPIQYLSMTNQIQTVFEGQKVESLKEIVPKEIRSINLILAIPQMLQFKNLYGIDFTRKIKGNQTIAKGKKLYNDFLELRKDRRIGEEYDVVRWWAEELNLLPYFSLKKEKDHFSNSETLEEQVSRIENDPFNLEGDSSLEDQEMAKFITANKDSSLNMAVVYYIIDCLNYTRSLEISEVQKIGFEIAEIGRLGIDPLKDQKYTLATVKDKTFTGWKMLAWMYTTWKIFNPEMAEQLGLEFKKEYELAKTMSKS